MKREGGNLRSMTDPDGDVLKISPWQRDKEGPCLMITLAQEDHAVTVTIPVERLPELFGEMTAVVIEACKGEDRW